MRFLRHVGIYRSDVMSVYENQGRGTASRWSDPAPVKERDGRSAFCSSSAMSSGRLILDQVARQQSLSPLHRQPQHKTIASPMGTIYDRTVNRVLIGCLSSRGHFSDTEHLAPETWHLAPTGVP